MKRGIFRDTANDVKLQLCIHLLDNFVQQAVFLTFTSAERQVNRMRKAQTEKSTDPGRMEVGAVGAARPPRTGTPGGVGTKHTTLSDNFAKSSLHVLNSRCII